MRKLFSRLLTWIIGYGYERAHAAPRVVFSVKAPRFWGKSYRLDLATLLRNFLESPRKLHVFTMPDGSFIARRYLADGEIKEDAGRSMVFHEEVSERDPAGQRQVIQAAYFDLHRTPQSPESIQRERIAATTQIFENTNCGSGNARR